MPGHSMNTLEENIFIAESFSIPASTQAILWDMDGVLIDSLGLDFSICNRLLSLHFGDRVKISNDFIRSLFAYHPPEFWRLILSHVEEKIPDAMKFMDAILTEYESARREGVFELNPGIAEILQEAKTRSLKMAVVSNNLTEDVKEILRRAGILDYFDAVIGNDMEDFKKKPAPDTYLFAAKTLKADPEKCVAVEDSLIGVEAGSRAGCHTVGVATGGTDFAELDSAPWTHQAYSFFKKPRANMQFGYVCKKVIFSPNEFISHMIEHIAWRLCVEIEFLWNNSNWLELGKFFGKKISEFRIQQKSSAALGMIDDGSAEVTIDITDDKPALMFDSIDELDLEWFVSVRCEQLRSTRPLVELMEGLAQGLRARIMVRVCSVQDPHHAWEGIFRTIGIALHRIFAPDPPQPPSFEVPVEENVSEGELSVMARSLYYSKVFRGTAESHVAVSVDFSKQLKNAFRFDVAPSINVSELHHLLERLAAEAGFTLQVEFKARALSSSHVVLEDTALVLGRALLEILMLRMTHWGVNAAGSSVQTAADLEKQPIRVGVSVEGRKFWLFVPFSDSYDTLKKDFLIGQNVYQHLRSEDLDDFLDGLAGGLTCSIIVHVKRLIEANEGWPLIFEHLGKALKEVFTINPFREGVPPGVKATLV